MTVLKGAAFYDLDRTLVRFNSGWLYAKYEREHGRVSRLMMARAAFALARYHLSLIDIERAYRRVLAQYKGMPDRVITERTNTWFLRDVTHALEPGAVKALAMHKGDGLPNVLLTNSSCYVARIAAQEWELDGWLANVFELGSDGNLTGGFEAPLCHGHGKVVRAQAWASEHGVTLDKSWFYTDSYSDVPMLEAVAFPRIVNPDPRLKRYAAKRNWPVLDWR